MDVICKVVFGLILIGAGIYHIYIYIRGKAKATIMDLLSGVVVFVLGVFLFMTPSIVIKLLPWMLSAFVLVDSLWKFKGAFLLKKGGNGAWSVLPVSYTHLDVYKRQMLMWADILRRRDYTLQPAGYLFFRIPFTSFPKPRG